MEEAIATRGVEVTIRLERTEFEELLVLAVEHRLVLALVPILDGDQHLFPHLAALGVSAVHGLEIALIPLAQPHLITRLHLRGDAREVGRAPQHLVGIGKRLLECQPVIHHRLVHARRDFYLLELGGVVA